MTVCSTNKEVNIKAFKKNLDGLYKQYRRCNEKFVKNQNGFIKKVIDYSKQGKNHKHLAADLKFPESLVEFIVERYSWDYDTITGIDNVKPKNFSSGQKLASSLKEEFLKADKKFIFNPKKLLNSFEDEDEDEDKTNLVIEIILPDFEGFHLKKQDGFTWGDHDIETDCPFDYPNIGVPWSISLGEDSWAIRAGNFGSCVGMKSDKGKIEVLEMYQLMGKYL
jgi:hypothetical protein